MKAIIKIGGMHCAACVNRIERKISALEGVETVSVNLAAENATIVFDPRRISLDEVGKKIAQTGYDFLGSSPEPVSAPADISPALLGLRNRFLAGIAVGGAAMAVMHFHPRLPLPLSVFLFVTTTPFLFYTALPIFRAALFSLRSRALTMDVMYSLGIGVSFLSSLLATFTRTLSHDFLFYDTALMLAGFLMLGRYLEAGARQKTSHAIQGLMKLRPKTAQLIENGQERSVPVETLIPGALLRVKPGQQIPVDGRIEEGEGYVDESMMTGEPLPVWKSQESSVLGGTLNKSSTVLVRATRTGHDMLLTQIIALVAEAQSSKPALAQVADRAVAYFIPAILGLALLSATFWLAFGGQSLSFALGTFIAVVVIACPCALGLATPTAVVVGIGRAARLGILFRSGTVLEQAEKIGVFVFDKTGTLTKGRPEVIEIFSADKDERQVLFYAAGLENHSVHPLAEAILQKAQQEQVILPPASRVELLEGQGISGEIDGRRVLLGNPDWLVRSGVNFPALLTRKIEEWRSQAKILAVLALDGFATGAMALADAPRPEAAKAIESLKSMGLRLIMATGDHRQNAEVLAAQLGIGEVRSDLLPKAKSDIIRSLQEKGEIVAFAGDGINDAPALAQANLGLAMGGGTDIALEAGDVVLVKGDLSGAAAGLQMGRKIMGRIRQNLFWAFAYNFALLPLAAGVLYPFTGFNFRPEYGALAMALSSVTVVSLSLLLQRYAPPALNVE